MSDAGHHQEPTNFWQKWVFSTDHKVIGLQFLFAAILFVLLGGSMAIAVRYQLAWPSQHVPYYQILPGDMTSEAPEANVAHWHIGDEVHFTASVQGLPIGTVATITDFPQGVAVTVPIGTHVQTAAGLVKVVREDTHATVPISRIMGGYQYAQQNALVGLGQQVTLADGETWTILGHEIHVATGINSEQITLKKEPVRLPVRAADTVVSIEVLDQEVVNDDGESQAVQGQSNLAVKATEVTVLKEALTTDAYLQLFTMHATIMVFFVLMPVLLGGFGNFLIPLMIGARDMAFPKLNMLSFWISVPASLIMLLSFWVLHGPAGGGWTMYPPLSGLGFIKPELGTTLWLVSIALVGFTTIVGTLNYITTIINMRAPGLDMFRLPLTVWSLLVTSVLALFATPVLTAAGIMLLMDRTMGTMFFIAEKGGQPLLWQHLFWFFGHPEVYILILPPMGITSDILATFCRKPIFGYKPMVFAMSAIAGLGFIVWGHHMFQSGMNPLLGTTFMAATTMIAVPSAIKTFNWLGTIWGGNVKFEGPMLWALGFVSMFVIGGLSGIFMASAPVDIHIHDTYFIVGHIHYVFFGGTIMATFAGVYYWFPKMFGTQLNQKWVKAHFWMTLIGLNGTFFLMHVLGVAGHPRRYASIMEYPTLEHLQPMNVIMTIWAIALGIAQLPFFFNLFASMPRRGGRAVASVFVAMLGGTTFAGLTYWNKFSEAQSVLGKLAYGLVGYGTDTGFSNTQAWVGYLILLIVMLWIFASMVKGLVPGGKIATVICGGLTLAGTLYLMNKRITGKLADPDITDIVTQALAATSDLCISMGFAFVFMALGVALVYLIWAIGGRLKMVRVLNIALHIFMLPMFLSPLVLKPDLWIMRGMTQMLDLRCLILGLLCLPGLFYWLIKRPADQFGYEPGDNPWKANSLEWTITSPPPFINFEEIPTVYRGPYEFSSPASDEDYLTQVTELPPGVVEPKGH